MNRKTQLEPTQFDPDMRKDRMTTKTMETKTPSEPTSTGTDEGSLSPITVLLSKEIKKIVGKDAFDAAKGTDDPIGLTEKSLDVVIGAGWDTIGKLESAMRENSWWFKELDGFGEKKINLLTSTLRAFRSVHPHPEDVEMRKGIEEAK